jgi:DNA-binding NarL/FixJ family response regulator
MKMNENAVLSLSPDPNLLSQRESALRNAGFEVVSVATESHAWFEIEMGRCGVLLVCSAASAGAIHDLTRLFRRRCPPGTIVFVRNRTDESVAHEVDYVVSDSAGPERIVEILRSALHSESKAS